MWNDNYNYTYTRKMYHVLYYSIVLLLSVFVVVLTHQLYFVIDLLSLLIGPNNIVIIHTGIMNQN